eukprot:12211761-Alexandrium_andersonii.AAC.1
MCDVHESPSYSRPGLPGVSLIVTPSSRLYLGHKCRLACAVEHFHFQGLHYGPQHAPLAFDLFHADLVRDLAGNSFHAWCAAP